jgi:Icc-related predicted phosphoesterase
MSRIKRVLVVADELAPQLQSAGAKELRPDLVVSCGDLPFDYLEHLVGLFNVPLVFVPGNHDPQLVSARKDPLDPRAFSWHAHHGDAPGPRGGENIDGRIVSVSGLRLAGIGGCIRYNDGPNQYSQRQMHRRVVKLILRQRIAARMRTVDLVVTHAPPARCGDGPDGAHRGIEALHRLTKALQPSYLVHGHIHPHGFDRPDRQLGTTTIVNAIPFRMLEVRS